jgi:hypothetical protein
MAPEIVSRVEYHGPPVDVWSAGVLFYVIMSGFFPFQGSPRFSPGSTDKKLFDRIAKSELIQEKCIDNQVFALISKMMQKKAEDRITAEAALAEVKAMSEEESSSKKIPFLDNSIYSNRVFTKPNHQSDQTDNKNSPHHGENKLVVYQWDLYQQPQETAPGFPQEASWSHKMPSNAATPKNINPPNKPEETLRPCDCPLRINRLKVRQLPALPDTQENSPEDMYNLKGSSFSNLLRSRRSKESYVMNATVSSSRNEARGEGLKGTARPQHVQSSRNFTRFYRDLKSSLSKKADWSSLLK